KAIQQLDQVIQENASATEEMASTAEELSSQAEQLQDIIGFFRIDSKGVKAKGRQEQVKKPLAKHVPAISKANNGHSKEEGVALDLRDASRDIDTEFERT
ncbi:MAG: hypothetical protein PHC90_09360, partial [Syntrophorhabdaceae bacterium]|nr:hypothetical protein [Syntrophorhabdaceae bacterium]